MTHQEFQESVRACTSFLGDHYPRTVQERMEEIARSPYAELRSDHYGKGGFISEFEQEVAQLLGKESAVFMPSGTMAQQIALRIWADRAGNKTVGFHPESHLQKHEHMAYQELHGLEAELVGDKDRLFTLEDLQGLSRPLSALLIELPQREIGGQLPSWDELQAICSYAHQSGMKLHLDGARLWETGPFYGRPYHEIVSCFDSVYVSFYKILGGLAGAALAGPADFIAEARIWQRRHGGNLVNMFPNAISAKVGMDKHLPHIGAYVAKAAEVAAIFRETPGVEVLPLHPPTNMMHLRFEASEAQLIDAVGSIAQEEKCALFKWFADTPRGCYTELTIGSAALDIPTERIRKLVSEFADKIR